MAVLKELGLVEEHHLGQERGYYETVHDNPHYHFTCLHCGKVIEFDTPLVARMEQELCEREGIGVIHTYLHMSGHCGRCRGAEDPAAAKLRMMESSARSWVSRLLRAEIKDSGGR
jgi:Fur family ferric uptake transcriptional regulator